DLGYSPRHPVSYQAVAAPVTRVGAESDAVNGADGTVSLIPAVCAMGMIGMLHTAGPPRVPANVLVVPVQVDTHTILLNHESLRPLTVRCHACVSALFAELIGGHHTGSSQQDLHILSARKC